MDKRLREQIEACQAGSHALTPGEALLPNGQATDPQLAAAAEAIQNDPRARQFFERTQAWDRAIGQAVDQIPVPEGLADRILARLAAANATADPGAGGLLAESVAMAGEVPGATESMDAGSLVELASPAPSSPWLRRHWLGSTVSAVGAAVLVGLIAHAMWPAGELELDQLADQWQQQLTAQWQNDLNRVPADFALPRQVRVQPSRWQAIGKFPGSRVIAFELFHPQAGKAILYVTRMDRPAVPQAVPQQPQSQTGSRAVGYWRSGGLVYVLVTPGDLRSYRAFVEPSSAPLARVCPLSRASVPCG